MTGPLDVVSTWPTVATAGVAASRGGAVGMTTGPDRRSFPWASVTKARTALAVWVAVEEGTVELGRSGRTPWSSPWPISWRTPRGWLPTPTWCWPLREASHLFQSRHRKGGRPRGGRRRDGPFEHYLVGAVIEPLGLLDGHPTLGEPSLRGGRPAGRIS